MTFVVRVSLVAASLLVASCRRSPSAVNPADAAAPRVEAPSSSVTVLDAGARRDAEGAEGAEGAGSWSCDDDAARSRPLPPDPIVGGLALPPSGGAPVFTFVSPEGGRRHRGWLLAESLRVVEGPAVVGDAPPWVPAFAGDELRFVRLEPASPARVVVVDERASPMTELSIGLGDELAVDAAGAASTFVIAASSSRGVEVRVGGGTKAEAAFVIDDAYGPAVLVGPRGSVAIAARVDAALEQAKPTKEVPTASLEGAGQERVGSSLVVVGATGKRLAAHAIPAGAEVVGVTSGRDALLVASTRVAHGGRSVDVDAIRSDGRRERVGEFAARRGARLFPIAGPASEALREVLAIAEDGVAVLGARGGELPLQDVEAAFGARRDGDSLELWALREREGSRSLGPVRCAWRAR